jgi:hypothetical protein
MQVAIKPTLVGDPVSRCGVAQSLRQVYSVLRAVARGAVQLLVLKPQK